MGEIIFKIGYLMNEIYMSLQVGLVTNCSANIGYIKEVFDRFSNLFAPLALGRALCTYST